MEGFILTLAGTAPDAPVLPRRVRLELDSGTGRLRVDAPATDEAWRASVVAAWDAARRVTGRDDVDGHLEVVGTAPLAGVSSGLPVGLLAVAALLGRTPRPHFATGGVLAGDHDLDRPGWLEGGRFVARKAEAAAVLAPQVGAGVFVAPPVNPVETAMPVRCATDLGAAYARVDPEGYAHVAARHDDLRRADGLEAAGIDPTWPFACVHTRPGAAAWPSEVEGVQVVTLPHPSLPSARSSPGPALVRVGERGRVLWTVRLPDDPKTAAVLPALLESARRAA